MKNDYFRDEKLEYEDMEIPDELLFMVRRTVAADRKKKALVRRRRMISIAGSVAAMLFLCLTIGVNSSYAFAEAAVKIPVVKEVAQAMVVRNYKPEIMAVYVEYKAGGHTENTQKEAVGKKQEEALAEAAESEDSALPVKEEMARRSAEPMSAEDLEKLEVWKAEMTAEKLRGVTEIYTPELEKKAADTPEKLRTILLAELSEKDVALYGFHEDGKLAGAALRAGDAHQFFNWKYMNESGKLPKITCEDMDGDGAEEILVFLYNNAATEKKEAAKEKDETQAAAVSDNDVEKPEGASGESSGESTKSGEENGKTGEENGKPEKESVKPEKENGKAGEESGKPETENMKPGEESIKPEKENMEPGEESVKPEKESVKPEKESAKPKEESEETEQPADEIWVVSMKEETWTVAALTVEEYQNYIKEKKRQG